MAAYKSKPKAKAKPKAKSKGRSTPKTEVSMPSEESKTVSVRKISNGFVVRECTSNRTGYKEKETFTPKKPNITL